MAAWTLQYLGDRQFKESPAIACPEGEVYNGWFKAEGFDPKTQSDKDVPLLGSRQEQFLEVRGQQIGKK